MDTTAIATADAFPSNDVTTTIDPTTPILQAGRPWVRYAARIIDLYCYFMLLTLSFIITAAFLSLSSENDVIFALFLILLIPLLESLLLCTLGTSPGKWLLKTKLRSYNGDKLTFFTALKRTLLVYYRGFGLFIPIVSLVTLISNCSDVTTYGTTIWDTRYRLIVTHQKLGFIRASLAIIAFIAFPIVYGAFAVLTKTA